MAELLTLEQKLKQVSSCLHQVSGLLTGISMGLYCVKSSDSVDSATEHIDDVQSLLDEANREVSTASIAIREIEHGLVKQE